MPIHEVIKAFSAHQLDFSSEDVLQSQIAQMFTEIGISFQREVRLSAQDRIDFLVEDGLGVEVKIKGSPHAIYRQCKRYCASGQIRTLLLVTGRSMGLPDQINGKDCYVHLLGRSWL